MNDLMEKIVSLCKRRGFIFPGSEIYGGLGGTWDYGPLGVEIKNNIKRAWWKTIVQERDEVVGLDSTILAHSKVWEASGHVSSFSDPFSSCTVCGRQYRTDHVYDFIWESEWWRSLLKALKGYTTNSDLVRWAKKEGKKVAPHLALVLRPEVTLSWIVDIQREFKGIDLDFQNFVTRIGARANGMPAIPCPACGGELSEPSPASLMLPTQVGPVAATAQKTYLRPETCQGIFLNFPNVMAAMRMKIPFGIAQTGKAFRNEITPGNFIFRCREFEQMELEYFVKPGTDVEWHDQWVELRRSWFLKYGIQEDHIRTRVHRTDELAHYAKASTDIEYLFPWGWGEVEGIANRTDFDLRNHMKWSGEDMSVLDDVTRKRYVPYVIEPSAGVDRAFLAFLIDAYDEVKGGRTTTTESNKEVEVVLRLHKDLAPIKVAVLPLSKKEPLTKIAQDIAATLRPHFVVAYDEVASIGRRYRRQDEIGTPYCVTVDFESVEDKKVTVRDRDTMKQERVDIEELHAYMQEKLSA